MIWKHKGRIQNTSPDEHFKLFSLHRQNEGDKEDNRLYGQYLISLLKWWKVKSKSWFI